MTVFPAEHVTTRAARQGIGAGATDQDIVAVAPIERVVASAGTQDVRATKTVETVIPSVAIRTI